MTNISKYLKRFEQYQNGDLDQKGQKEFKEALEKDQEMKDAWEEYASMMEAFSDKEAVSLREKLEKTFYMHQPNRVRTLSHGIWFRAVAAAMIIISMGALLYYFCTNEASFLNWNKQPMMVTADSLNKLNEEPIKEMVLDSIQLEHEIIKEEIIETQIASIYDREEYQINPVFAELLNSVYRGNFFNIISPIDSLEYSDGENIVFSWETNITDPIYFDILDRNGQVLYRHDTPVSSPWEFSPELDPAIYMYRFATAEEPVWLGVIVEVIK